MSQEYTIEKLNEEYKKLELNDIKQLIEEIFKKFDSRNEKIVERISKKDIFLSSLGVLNSFDHYAQFYKGVVPNEKSRDEQVKCPYLKYKCRVCGGVVGYKCRTGGNRPMQLDRWHYSNNGKWEMATVGESYKNFLKNTGVKCKKQQEAIYNLRNNIDHKGFFEKDSIVVIKKSSLYYNNIDLYGLLTGSLSKFETELSQELDQENFRVEKSSRVIRFLDHLYYVRGESPID